MALCCIHSRYLYALTWLAAIAPVLSDRRDCIGTSTVVSFCCSLLRTSTCAYMKHASHGASIMELKIGSRITLCSLGWL
ncbi:hypothetical protein M441DRAFT_372405 [Trichoderma asperellum CBS 433.97]|uniref:Secreted protein n=1 Tax=Trichoderma asperellum (strain ATCC 204424 / CBS 433.97 / NBRC 101777) TaxID=1042311 RepID=A0A2T3ZF65_TRIA4|nr:hypothetical protein M441DRAFT_372405 [Trichoderma asperellum CBS 433.97]PTB43429.1 hypothetical protein M441DRAFT_372405 [Trichoderma asperellum CBS 433.97]